MKSLIFAPALCLLVACGSPAPKQTPEQAAASAKFEAAWATREAVLYKGNTYEFARHPERPVAYVQASNTDFQYSLKDIEQVAQNKTSCKGKVDPGVLAFVGGFSRDADISNIQENGGKPFRWSAALAC